MNKYGNEDTVVGNEELGHHSTDFSSEVGDHEGGSCFVANCNDKTTLLDFLV